MQVPPPAAWRTNFTLRQLRASWYMLFFQLPRLPEWWASANDFEENGKVHVPTLFIYGEQDVAVLPETVRDVGRFVAAPYHELRIPESGHRVQNEAVAKVNYALLQFLGDESLAVN
jgi:pimeloyl-ACP methyl ester carboxylesterase